MSDEPERLPPLLGGDRSRSIAVLVAIGFAQAAAAIGIVLAVSRAFDDYLGAGPGAPLSGALPLGAAILVAVLVNAGLLKLERVRAEILGQQYVLQVRSALFEHLTRVEPRVLQQRSRGGVLLRFLGDLTPVRLWVSLGLARIVVASVLVSSTVTALAFLNRVLAAWVLAAIAGGALGLLALGRQLEQATREARRQRSHLATNVTEKLAAISVVQVHGQEKREQNRLERQGQRLFEAMVSRAHAIGRVRFVAQATTGIATLGVLGLGIQQVASGATTPGIVVAAMTLVGLLVPPLRDLSRVFEYWQGARVAREKIEDFLALPELAGPGDRAPKRRRKAGRLSFKEVTVDGSLWDVDAIASAGSVVAVVGPNGSGKSTLLALASRLVEPDEGRVLLDGRNLVDIAPELLRREVGMAGPDLPLLRGSIRWNLRYRWPKAPDEEVQRACALCGVDEVLARLPAGADTRVQEAGTNLSVGERQRIALARAILGSPNVLLLDEVDANLDRETYEALERVLAHYPGTVLLATHDQELANSADEIWCLDRGRLVDSFRIQTASPRSRDTETAGSRES